MTLSVNGPEHDEGGMTREGRLVRVSIGSQEILAATEFALV
jgi:hypothetical protein